MGNNKDERLSNSKVVDEIEMKSVGFGDNYQLDGEEGGAGFHQVNPMTMNRKGDSMSFNEATKQQGRNHL